MPLRSHRYEKPILLCALFTGGFCALAAQADTNLSLEDYLAAVTRSNQGYQGSIATSSGALAASGEGELVYAPQAFTSLQHTDDRRPTIVPVFEGNRTLTDAFSLGVKKLTDFGMQAQVAYTLTSQTIYGVSPALVPQPSLITTGLQLQVTQPLWQDGFGRIERENQRMVEAQDKYVSYTNAYDAKVALSDAESRYWKLAVAREVVSVQRESMNRNRAIRDYNAKRVRNHLIDEADLLQSEAAVKSKELDLKAALDSQRAAARAFNSARGIDSDEVSETLPLPDPDRLRGLPIPQRSAMRDDVKAAEQNQIAAIQGSEIARERQLPSLIASAIASTNGLDPSVDTATESSFTTQHPYYQLGLNFSVPLDFSATSAVRAAYAKQIHGAELTYQRKLFDQENNWTDLVRRFEEAKARLAIAVDLQGAQRVKVDSERRRLKQGLTTTYQVFLFEQDYISAQLSRLQIEGEILDLLAQMKTYRGDS